MIIFPLILIVIMIVDNILYKQSVAYLKLLSYYTNQLLNSEITLDEYKRVKEKLIEGLSPVLLLYLKWRCKLDV